MVDTGRLGSNLNPNSTTSNANSSTHALLFCNMNSDRQFTSYSPALGPSADPCHGFSVRGHIFAALPLWAHTPHAVASQISTAVSQGCRDTDTYEKDLYESGSTFVAHRANEELENRF